MQDTKKILFNDKSIGLFILGSSHIPTLKKNLGAFENRRKSDTDRFRKSPACLKSFGSYKSHNRDMSLHPGRAPPSGEYISRGSAAASSIWIRSNFPQSIISTKRKEF